MAREQASVTSLKNEIDMYTAFLEEKVIRLTTMVKQGNVAQDLAGLMAVAAYRLAPSNPDDPSDRTIRDALWMALSRLDERAAQELRGAEGNSRGPTSALLSQEICKRFNRHFTFEEWMELFSVSEMGRNWREDDSRYSVFPCWDN